MHKDNHWKVVATLIKHQWGILSDDDMMQKQIFSDVYERSLQKQKIRYRKAKKKD